LRQFAIVGLGRFGEAVGTALHDLGQTVLGIDRDPVKVQAMADILSHTVQADATLELVLDNLGLARFDAAVVAVGADIETSALVTVTLKELGVKHVVARASSALHGRLLARIGADRVIFPERDIGVRVANGLLYPNVLEYFELLPHYSIIEITAPRFMHGQTLNELRVRQKFEANIVLIRRGEQVNATPGGADVVLEGDLLVVSGTTEGLQRLGSLT
jgi:trk system potassium uptake protein TrkA